MGHRLLKEIISETPLHEVFSIQLFKTNGDFTEDGKNTLLELFHTKKVDLKCTFCEKEYAFDVSKNITKELFEAKIYVARLYGYPNCSIDDQRLIVYGCEKYPNYDDGIIEYTLKCTMKPEHYYKVYLHYCLTEGKLLICKIGQTPSISELKQSNLDDFRKILLKYDAVEDYAYFEKCSDSALLAGACTYLRRIFEKIVAKKYENIPEEKKASIKNFKEKINSVSDQFDAEIRGILHDSYKLLCRGVHELSNQEIERFYELMAEVINIQLESEKETLERNQKMAKLRKSVRQKANGDA